MSAISKFKIQFQLKLLSWNRAADRCTQTSTGGREITGACMLGKSEINSLLCGLCYLSQLECCCLYVFAVFINLRVLKGWTQCRIQETTYNTKPV